MKKIRTAETTSFCLSEIKHLAWICQFPRGVVITIIIMFVYWRLSNATNTQ